MMDRYHHIRWIRFLPLLLILAGLPLAFKMIPPNQVYGVRIPATLASDASWYRANFWAGLSAAVFGAVALIINQMADRSTALRPATKSYVIAATLIAVVIGMTAAGVAAA